MKDEVQKDLYFGLISELESMLRRANGDGRDAGAARADLARLRRGMGQPYGTVIEATSVIERMLREDTPDWVAESFSVVAPLFAFHQISADVWDWSNNMGAHFRKLCEEGEPPPPNIERRFTTLLNSDPDDLPDALRQAISLLKAKEIAVNWRQLCRDVEGWLNRTPEGEEWRRKVRLAWAQAFWRLPTNSKRADTATEQVKA